MPADPSVRVNVFAYNAVLQYSRAQGRYLAFLLVLAKWSNDEGQCWPAISTIARLLHCSERAAQAAKQKLVNLKELEIVGMHTTCRTEILKIASVAQAPRPARVKQTAVKGEEPNTRTAKNASPKEPIERTLELESVPDPVSEESRKKVVSADFGNTKLAVRKQPNGTHTTYPPWYLQKPAIALTRKQLENIGFDIQIGVLRAPPEGCWLHRALGRLQL